MYRVLLYDSNKNDALTLREIVKETLTKIKCNFQLVTYYESISNMLKKIEIDSYQYDIIVLNVFNEDEDAFKAAKTIRDYNTQCIIIFTSLSDDKIYEAFRFKASGFLIKPLDKEKVALTISDAIKDLSKMKRFFQLKSRGVLARIPYKSIDYFESCLRNVRIIINDENSDGKVFSAKLEDVHNSLPKKCFVRCHQSYIVNVNNVRYIDKAKKKIIMHSGHEVFISKRYYPKVIHLFTSESKEH